MYLVDVQTLKSLSPIQTADLQAFLSVYGFGLESHAVSALVIDPESRIIHISEFVRDDGRILTSPTGVPLQKHAMRPFKDSCEPPKWIPTVAQRIVIYMVPDIDPDPELPLFIRPSEVSITVTTIHVPDDCVAIQASILFSHKGMVARPDDMPVWAITDESVLQLSSLNQDHTAARINIVGVGETDIIATSITNQGTVIRFSGTVVVYESGNVVKGEMSMTSIDPVETEGLPVPTSNVTDEQ